MIKAGLIGTGGMGNHHANAIAQTHGLELRAVCDIESEKVQSFGAQHGISQVFTDPEKFVQEADMDAVIVATPDRFHRPAAIAALQAGKHVFCEKPLATDAHEAQAMLDAANAAGTVNLVNFTYRKSSALQKAAEWVASGELGRIYHVEAHYLQGWLLTNYWGDVRQNTRFQWRLSQAHGSGGVLGDIGVHILDFATFPVGEIARLRCKLKNFAEKFPGNQIGEYRLDANDTAVVTLEFKNDAIGSIRMTRCASGFKNALQLTVCGELGALQIDLDTSYDVIERCRVVDRDAQPWERLYCGEAPTMLERFVRAIETGEPEQPDFQRGVEIQKLLDAALYSDREAVEVDLRTFEGL
ncbi:MAG: Gfo/Idh/MocA family protein [Opitutales bacterium]